MEPSIATGLEKIAIQLESHIRYYVPKGWRENIGSAASCPMFSGEDVEVFVESYKIGKLRIKIEELSKSDDFPYNQLKPFYVKEGIEDYFMNVFEKKYSGKEIKDI